MWCLQFIPGLLGAAAAPVAAAGKGGPGSPSGSSQGSEANDLLVVGCWDKTLSLYRLNGKSHRIQGERSLRFYPCGLSIANLQGNKTNYMVISGSNKKVNLYSRDGMRLAELQLKIVWEEILKRFETIEVVGEPKRIYSSFVKGYETLPVRISP